MAKNLTLRESAERLLRIVREAISLIAELIRAGDTPEQISEFSSRSIRAKAVRESIVWRIGSQESVPAWIMATQDALAFLESHKDPKADIKDAFVVENFASEVIGDFKRCRDYETQCHRVPFTLEDWLGSFEGAVGRMENSLAKGLECIAVVIGKRHAEWRGREISATQELPPKVTRRSFETYDLINSARQIREKAAHERQRRA